MIKDKLGANQMSCISFIDEFILTKVLLKQCIKKDNLDNGVTIQKEKYENKKVDKD